ncbi:MAG: bifunctional 23S rRNA (guanine(2069)-N(7))-methyltransferase RlmK/23S rRNA (guanine(2445)-N(2))-methyltransferase RlmL, partial [Gemmatimonadota bacterium]
YRACLWSRLASRVLLVLAEVEAATADALYQGLRGLAWHDHLRPTGTLAVSFNGTSQGIANSHFGALRAKDAVVDHFRDRTGSRPSVDLERPDLRIDVHLHLDRATVSLDLSGQPLHRRGYRVETVEAPLKENLAAAVLLAAGWPEVAAAGGPLADLMCGSGTLLIEGAWMAADRAPALGRQDLGLLRWPGHDQALWDRLVAEAEARRAAGHKRLPAIRGFDADAAAVKATWANLERAGLKGRVHVERRTLESGGRPGDTWGEVPGLVVANPPYGHRLGQESGLRALYAELASQLRSRFPGWRAAVLATRPEWAAALGLGGPGTTLYNGALECHLSAGAVPSGTGAAGTGTGAAMFGNRLRKNLRTIGRWARRAGITCYRLYDADMPEYSLAVDLYRGERLWAHVQEYRAPESVDPMRAAVRLQEALVTIPEVLEIPPEQLFFKVRERQRGAAQYQRLGDGGTFCEVAEGPCTFLVNFTDYLDTGLFLDHRPTREVIRRQASGRRFLNLFGYTGTATVCAAAGGALSTTTVDLSSTYLQWARRNLQRNGFSGTRHALVQADCREWLAAPPAEPYDLIFLDPPTFSNSKRMEGSFDVQRDHVELIAGAARLLAPGGVLLFSTNARRFELRTGELEHLACEDITRATIPRDFERNPRIHQCWRLTPRPPPGG